MWHSSRFQCSRRMSCYEWPGYCHPSPLCRSADGIELTFAVGREVFFLCTSSHLFCLSFWHREVIEAVDWLGFNVPKRSWAMVRGRYVTLPISLLAWGSLTCAKNSTPGAHKLTSLAEGGAFWAMFTWPTLLVSLVRNRTCVLEFGCWATSRATKAGI